MRHLTGVVAASLAILAASHAFVRADDDVWRDCRTGDRDRKIAGCTKVLDRGDRESAAARAAAFQNRAWAYNLKGDPDRAIADASEAIRLDPKRPYAFNDRGVAYLHKGDPDRAITDLSEAIRVHPGWATAFKNRAWAYNLKHDPDRAVADIYGSLPPDDFFFKSAQAN